MSGESRTARLSGVWACPSRTAAADTNTDFKLQQHPFLLETKIPPLKKSTLFYKYAVSNKLIRRCCRNCTDVDERVPYYHAQNDHLQSTGKSAYTEFYLPKGQRYGDGFELVNRTKIFKKWENLILHRVTFVIAQDRLESTNTSAVRIP